MIVKKLRSKRVAAEIPATLLAAKAKVNRSRLSNLERGYFPPTEAEPQRLSGALNQLIQAKSAIHRPQSVGLREPAMTIEHLTAVLAEKVMGWSVAPDRFLTGKRGWIPRWKFRPTECLADAFRLLEAAKPRQYTMHYGEDGLFTVRVQLGKAKGEACNSSKPRSISYAIARAAGIEVRQT